jgi:hypothetical protein
MPRVVPSQVVALIDRMFPAAQRQLQGDPNPFILDLSHVGAASAIIEVVEQIPNELLPLDAGDYATLIASVTTIRGAIPLWQSGDRRFIVHFVHGWNINPVSLIRQILSACPDDRPSPATTELAFIVDADLRESIRLDISGANRDLAEGEWKGATVLAGSAIEALLLWALQEQDKQKPGGLGAAVAALLGAKTLTRNPGPDPEAWGLHEYVEVVAYLKLIEDETATLVRLAKDFRNLIHPGRAARLGQKCDRSTALTALAAVEAVALDLTP